MGDTGYGYDDLDSLCLYQNGRDQGLLHGCLIRCAITPQVWWLEAHRDQIQQHQTRISETSLEVKTGEREKSATTPSSPSSYRIE